MNNETEEVQVAKFVSPFNLEMPLREATDRMSEAIVLHAERDFHVKDYVREPGEKAGKGRPVNLRPAAGWLALALEQLGLSRKK